MRSKNKLNRREAQLFFAFLGVFQISYFIMCWCSCTARGAQVSSMPDAGREQSGMSCSLYLPYHPLHATTQALCPPSLYASPLGWQAL
jgi:hypothetical protein